jgi:succinate dehydrogenase iron-sulfur subunit
MEVTLRVRHFNPETDQASHVETYKLPAGPMDRVLDLLHYVKWNLDGSLTFRRSCAHGVCGSDAMLINGANRLACKVLVRELGEQISVEPLRGLTVKKDLLVDMDPFFESYRGVLPFLINDEPAPDTERRQSPEQRKRFDDTTKCILCAACTTSCPVFWADDRYFGPASIVNAHRFIFDSRDQGGAERLELLNDKEGVWRCRTTFNARMPAPAASRSRRRSRRSSGRCCSARPSGRNRSAALVLDLLLGGRQLAGDPLPERVDQLAEHQHRHSGDDPEGDPLGDLARLLGRTFSELAHLFLHAPARQLNFARRCRRGFAH